MARSATAPGYRSAPVRAASAFVAESLEQRLCFAATTSDLSVPTNWSWWHGVDAAFLNNKTAQEGSRIIDIEVDSASPTRFTAALVKNAGSYAAGWHWWFGQTLAQIGQKLAQNNERLVDLESYVSGGQRLYAAVMVSNTGANNKAWWYYAGQTSAQLATRVSQTGGRIVDLDSYDTSGGTRYDAVLIKNAGADSRNWHYYFNVSAAEVSAKLSQNSSRLTDIEDRGNGRFDIVMERSSAKWWWYYGKTETDINNLAAQNGARIFDIEKRSDGRFAAVMINNSNATSTRVGDILRGANSSDTVSSGAFLKEVNGPVVASVNENRRYEPASGIKALAHVTALRAVTAGSASLGESINYYFDPSDPTNPDICPENALPNTASNRITTTLSQALERMMERSDNRTTRAVQLRFGNALLNATALALGMTRSQYTQIIGCGDPGNYLTARDIAALYERVRNGTAGLSAAATAQFDRLMLDEDTVDTEGVAFNEGVPGFVRAAVSEEAAARLGLPASDPLVQSFAAAFLAKVRSGQKGGSYNLGINSSTHYVVRTNAGWIGLPYKDAQGNVVTRNFVFSAFIDQAKVANAPSGQQSAGELKVEAAIGAAEKELVRDTVRAAIASWGPVVRVSNAAVVEGNSGTRNLTFTVSLSAKAGRSVSVLASTLGQTASSSSDYFSASQLVTLAAGTTSKSFSVVVRGDATKESSETLLLTLGTPTYGVLADDRGVGTIVNDDF